LLDVGSSRISIFTVNTYVSLGCSGNTTRIMRRTLDTSLTFHSIARLRFCYLSVLPLSSEVIYASATFPCIGRVDGYVPLQRLRIYWSLLFPSCLSIVLESDRYGWRALLLERPFFWIDAFACPALFPWHTGKSVSRDVIPKSFEFSAEHYATLVASPAPFHKYSKPFLCLVGMSHLLSFIRTADPTKVRIGERQRDKDEPKILETTVGRIVSLLPVAPARSSSGEHGVGIQLVDVVAKTVFEDVAPVQPKRQKKRKTKVVNAGECSHLTKKLRDDHGALSGPTVGGKSQSSIQRLFAGAFIYFAIGDVFCFYHAGASYSVVRTSMPIITSATTTPTADLTAIAKEKLVSSYYNIRERRRLNFIVEEKDALLKAKDEEIRSLKAQLVLKEVEAAEAICLRVETSNFEVVEKSLQTSVKVREQEVADLDAVVTSVKLQNDNLVDQVHKLEASSIGLQEKVTAAAIGKAVEKGMQDGLSTGITHGAEGRVLTDVAAYNPSAKVDYLSALHLQSVNFSLIEELKSNKDASIDTTMNLLHLKDSLAEKLGLTESQPHVDQLMVLIHHSLDQRVVGASSLSLSLDVSISRVRRIKENIAKHRSALRDVFVPLSEPLSITALTGTKSTLNVIPATVDTTKALSITSVFASLIPPISTNDYEITHAEGEKSVGVDANPFPDVDDAELNIHYAFVTSYGPSHLGPNFLVSFARLASLLRSKLISKASLFPTRSTFVVLSVGMPISAGMTASVLYVNENGVSLLLDFIIVRVSLITANRQDLRSIALAFFTSAGKVTSTSTCLLKCAKLVEAILLRSSAFLFSLLGICLIENALKLPEDPSVNKIHGLGSSPSSSSSIGVSIESYSGLSTMKSANICHLTNTLGFQAKMSKLRWSSPHNLFRPPSVRVEPIITVCSGYYGFIATLTLSSIIGLAADGVSPGPETITHSSRTNLLLFRRGVTKSVAFPLVKNYVTNTWSKFGFQKVIRDEEVLFFFRFDSITGVEQVLEQGQIGFTRALIEVSATADLKKEVIMAIPHKDGAGHIKCSKRVVELVTTIVEDKSDRFTTITNKRRKGKKKVNPTINKPGGIKPSKTKTFEYRPIATTNTANKEVNKDIVDRHATVVNTSNPFSVLNDDLFCHVEEGEPSGLNTNKVFKAWDWTSNAHLCSKGCRIVLGWNTEVVNIIVLAQTNQAIHMKMIHKTSNEILFCSFIYAGNTTSERRLLWTELGLHKHVVRGCPWVLIGDFNMALNLEDSLSGSSRLNAAMYAFKVCVNT
nr:RNA-directed DNA polymerase, eukaryota, reverse transcriptase zinc-binding domain protein [Tanacetum cinerariifolium]